jgi:hypothetical protein
MCAAGVCFNRRNYGVHCLHSDWGDRTSNSSSKDAGLCAERHPPSVHGVSSRIVLNVTKIRKNPICDNAENERHSL